MWVNPLKESGHYLDNLNLMTYDAGNYTFSDTTHDDNHGQFNPIEAYKAYKAIFKGTVNIGLESPAEAWGGNILTSNDIQHVADQVELDPKDGLFMWSLQKENTGPIDTKQLMEQMCTNLNLTNCFETAKPLQREQMPMALIF